MPLLKLTVEIFKSSLIWNSILCKIDLLWIYYHFRQDTFKKLPQAPPKSLNPYMFLLSPKQALD